MNNDQPPFMRGKYRKQFEDNAKQAIEEKPVNNELIKRIDALLALRVENSATATINNDCPLDPAVENALRDCRAEIEFLLQVNEGLRNQNTELDESLAELEAEIERTTKALAKANERAERFEREWYLRGDEIERLSKPYIPMTEDEISQMMQDWYNDTSDQTSLPRFIEQAVIKRAGLEIKHD